MSDTGNIGVANTTTESPTTPPAPAATTADVAEAPVTVVSAPTPPPVPTVGRIVLYQLSEYDVAIINKRRAATNRYSPIHEAQDTGVTPARGNYVNEDDVFPMLIVRVWGKTSESCVNGRVFLDGTDDMWVTSVNCGTGSGYFMWPARA